MTETATPEILRHALIHDLAIVLAGSLHPGAETGPAPRLAAHRMRDVLGIEDGETVRRIEGRLLAALGLDSAVRFADFYSVRYGDVGSGGRALIVETDEPMEIRPLTDRKVIVKRA